MMVAEAIFPAIGAELARAQRVLVVSHIRPDGDAVGSLLGLGLSLTAAGKEVRMVMTDGIPANFRFLPGADQVHHRPKGPYDFSIVVDCSDLERTGLEFPEGAKPDLNIDHHVTNLNFARYNVVVPQAVAAAELVADLLPALGLPITQPVATALLTGLIADTLGFRTSNMTPKAMRLAADLMDYDINMPELYRRALVEKSFEATRYWGMGLARLQLDQRLAWTALTLADRKAVGYPGRDDADLINVLASICDADIAVIFVEQADQRVKVSWRAQPGFDVSQIAVRFGGGGHPAASGADISGPLDHIQAAVLQETRLLLNHHQA